MASQPPFVSLSSLSAFMSTPYQHLITPQGAERLQSELDFLWRIERPQVTQQVSDAAKLGDRSENAEYIYGKKRLRQIDRRVRFLTKRLEHITVVTRKPSNVDAVYFGAWVCLEDDDGVEYRYRIVGSDEINLDIGYISVQAPLARGLLGKCVDDEVRIHLPKGAQTFYVLSITYDKPDWDAFEPVDMSLEHVSLR